MATNLPHKQCKNNLFLDSFDFHAVTLLLLATVLQNLETGLNAKYFWCHYFQNHFDYGNKLNKNQSFSILSCSALNSVFFFYNVVIFVFKSDYFTRLEIIH